MVIVGTICTLVAFTFTQPDGGWAKEVWGRVVHGVAWVGRLFLVLAFGVAFAGALTASLSILIGRIQYLIDVAIRVVGR
jgi:hypothetical protein